MELINIINLQDGAVDPEETKTEEWQIQDDSQADWWIEVKNEEIAQEERLLNQLEEKAHFYQMQIEARKKEIARIKAHRDGKLELYFASLPDKAIHKTKTQEKYSLPTGTLIRKYPRQTYKRDDEALVQWLKNTGRNELIKVKETPDWASLKKETKVIDDKVYRLDQDSGEIEEVAGVKVEYTEPTFELK